MNGKITFFTGAMFSGKTEKLIKTVSDKNGVMFKPKLDTRYSENVVKTHSGISIPCITVSKPDEVFTVLEGIATKVVGIDEVQFFDSTTLKILLSTLKSKDYEVYLAGLTYDYLGKMFKPIRTLLNFPDKIEILYGTCSVCGKPSKHTQRITDSNELIEIGGEGQYEPRCSSHFYPQGTARIKVEGFGELFDILNPNPEFFTFENIARGLARECRFSKQITHYYSVAQHTCLMIALARDAEEPLEVLQEIALHDAAEAFLPDMPKPWKVYLPKYNEIEGSLQAAIFEDFGINPKSKRYKKYDNQAYELEKARLFTPYAVNHRLLTTCWNPTLAKRKLMAEFRKLL